MTDIGQYPGNFDDAERQAQIDAMTHRPLQIDPRAVAVSEGVLPFLQEAISMGSFAREPLARIRSGEGGFWDPTLAFLGGGTGIAATMLPGGAGPVATTLRGTVSPLARIAADEASRLAPRLAPFAAPAAAGIALAPGEAQSAALPAPPFSNILWNLRHGLGLKGETKAQLPSYWQQRVKNPLPSFEVEGVTFKGSPREEQEALRQYLDIMARGPEAGTPITKEELAAQLEAQAIPSLRTKHLGHGRSFADEPVHESEGRILPGEVGPGGGEEILSQWDTPVVKGPMPERGDLNFPLLDTKSDMWSTLVPLSDELGVDLYSYARNSLGVPDATFERLMPGYTRNVSVISMINKAIDDGVVSRDVARPVLQKLAADTQTDDAYLQAMRTHNNPPEPLYRAPEVHYAGELGENLFAHSRSTPRQNTAGEWGRLIDESQSDLHQAAREQGYNPSFLDDLEHADLAKRRLNAAEGNAAPLTVAEEARRVQLEANINAADDQAELAAADPEGKIKPRLPDAPLKKDWQQYQLKQEIARAIERGDDYVALVPGRVQAHRWSLQKQLSKIEWDPSTGKIQFYDPDGDLMTGKRIPKEIKEGELGSYIGKEIAQKLIAAKPDMAAADAAFRAHPWYEGLPDEYKRPLSELHEDRKWALANALSRRRKAFDAIEADHSNVISPARHEFESISRPAIDEHDRVVDVLRAKLFKDIREAREIRAGMSPEEDKAFVKALTDEFDRMRGLAAQKLSDIDGPARDRFYKLVGEENKKRDRAVEFVDGQYRDLEALLATPTTNSLEGRELRIGGAGSRKSYDRDQPKSMEGIVRQYTGDPKASVETMKIPTNRTVSFYPYEGIWDSSKSFPSEHKISRFIRDLDSAWVHEDDMARILPKLEALEKMGRRLDDEKLVSQLLDNPQGEEAATLMRAFNKARAEFGRDIAALDEKYKFSTGIELEVPAIRMTDKMRDAYRRVKAKTGSGFSRYAVPPVATLPFFERLYGEQPQEEFNAP